MIFRLATLTFASLLAAHAAAQTVTAPEARRMLELGNERFVRGERLGQKLDEGTRRTAAANQRPLALVVTSSDSRVVPEHLFDAGLGELYVVRVAGTVCDPAALASMEFAVGHLGVELCVVMGHDRCDALGYLDRHSPISEWDEHLQHRLAPSLRRAAGQGLEGTDRIAAAATENVYATIADAVRRSPILRDALQNDRLTITPTLYESATGAVEWLPERSLEDAVHPDAKVEPGTRTQRVRGLPPHVAMRLLHAGHLRFLSRGQSSGDVTAERRNQLLEGQHPYAIVVADADARLAPELVFDAGLGDVYVVRVAGGMLTEEVLASIEQAVEWTGASLVVVLGSDRSEAIQLAMQRGANGGDSRFITPSLRAMFTWLEPAIVAARATDKRGRHLLRTVAEINCARFVQAARSRSDLLQRAESAGLVAMIAGVYATESGDIEWIDLAARQHAAATPAAPAGETAARLPAAERKPHHPEKGHSPNRHAHSQPRHHEPAAHGSATPDSHGTPPHATPAHAASAQEDPAAHQPAANHPSTGHPAEDPAPGEHVATTGGDTHPEAPGTEDPHGSATDDAHPHPHADTAVDADSPSAHTPHSASSESLLSTLLIALGVAIGGVSILMLMLHGGGGASVSDLHEPPPGYDDDGYEPGFDGSDVAEVEIVDPGVPTEEALENVFGEKAEL